MTFNRLKSLVNNDKDVLKEVLISINSNLIEAMVTEEKVRRRLDKPLPLITEELKKSLNERTIHLKGIPKHTTYEELMNWCLKYGNVETIQMREKTFRNKKKGFKGCLFVTFADKAVADELLNEPKTTFGDKELVKENKLQYYNRKQQMAEQRAKLKLEAKVESMDLDREEKDKDSLLKLINVPKELTQNKIREYFEHFFENESKVKFVLKIFSKSIAFVRFSGHNTAEQVIDNLRQITQNFDSQQELRISIDGKELVVIAVTDEEEKDLNKRAKKVKNSYTNSKRLVKNVNKYVEKRIAKLKENPVLEPLAVLHVENSFRSLTEKKIREFFLKYPKIIDIDKDFNIRFEQRFAARNVLVVAKKDDPNCLSDKDYGVLVIDGIDCTANVVTGEEEKQFWLASIDRIERKHITAKVWKRMKKTMAMKISQYGLEEEMTPKVKRFMNKRPQRSSIKKRRQI